MSNIIQIKHGTTAPGNNVLSPYELGYSDDGSLYIGIPSGENSTTKKIYDTRINDSIYINDEGFLTIKIDSKSLDFTTTYTTNTVNMIVTLDDMLQIKTISPTNFIQNMGLLTTSGGTVDTLTVTNHFIVSSNNYGKNVPTTAGKTGQLYFVLTE